jgi:serine/threonine protein kinase
VSAAKPIEDAEVEPGIEVGPWMIESRIGEGGMALVFAAQHNATGERGALKVLRAELAGDKETAARFAREARILRGLEHPGIVPVLDTGRLAGGRPWLVLAELTGCTLRALLDARKTITPAEAWPIARAVLDALAVAHAASVVHRDVKPGNIFLEGAKPSAPSCAAAQARLLDFGLAKADERLDEEAVKRVTQTGAPVGTPAYMAPEQWWGKAVDARTDLYGLGATIFELLAGTPPHRGDTYAELVEHVLHDPVPSIRARNKAVSAAVDGFVARLLAREPVDRFANAWIARAAGDEAFAAPMVDAPLISATTTPLPSIGGAAAPAMAGLGVPPPPPAPIPMLSPAPPAVTSATDETTLDLATDAIDELEIALDEESTHEATPARPPAPRAKPPASPPARTTSPAIAPPAPAEAPAEAEAPTPGPALEIAPPPTEPAPLPDPPRPAAIELAETTAPSEYPAIPRPSPLPDVPAAGLSPSAGEPGRLSPVPMDAGRRSRPTPLSPEDYTPRYYREHVAIALVGVLAIVALGYAGSAPRDVLGWMHDGGWGMVPLVLSFFLSAGLLPRYGVRRAMLGATAHVAFAIAAAPVVLASMGTWLSWGSVKRTLEMMEPARAFVVLHTGVVEAHVPRFVGFALGAVSFLLLAALPTRRFREQRAGAWRVSDVAAGGLAGLTLLALLVGARSGAFVAAVGATGIFLGRGLSPAPTRIRFNEAIDHAVASLAATLLAIGAAFARLDALVAAPFGDEGVTRAARVDAIMAAASERNLSRYFAAVAVSTVLGIAAIRLLRLRPTEGRLRVPRSGMAVLMAMPAFFALDAGTSAVFHAKRAELDALLAPQFTLQSELVPPQARGGWLATPVDAPALQMTATTIAVEGRPIARVEALAASATRDGVVQEIARAVAANPPTQDHPDLALLADRSVSWADLEVVLRLARQGGARKVDVLLTRGDPVPVPKTAPPEANAVTPSDFAALRIELVVAGGEKVTGATFDAVASQWLAGRSSAAPIVVGVGW